MQLVSDKILYGQNCHISNFSGDKHETGDVMNNRRYNYIYVITGTIFGVIGCFVINGSIWLDEAFTMEMIQHDYIDIINLTADDVHPFMYYFICKLGVDLLKNVVNQENIFIVAKWITFVPFVIGIVSCIYVLREALGRLYCAIYVLFMLIMPEILHYSYEIRMYSYGMMFVLNAYVSTRRIMLSNGNSKNWKIFVMWSLLASYTHYYACVAVVFLYLSILGGGILQGWKSNQIQRWFKYCIISLMLYLPWLYVVIRTLGRIDEVFHTSIMTWRTVVGYFMYIVTPDVGNRYFKYAIAVLVYLLIILLCKNKINRKPENLWELVGIGISFWVIGIGVFVSLIIKPLFLPRYIVLTLPCFWLSLCMMLADLDREGKKTGYIITAILCVLNFVNIKNTISAERGYKNELDRLQKCVVFKDNSEIKIITLFSTITDKVNRESHLNGTITTQFNVDTYLYEMPESELTRRVYHNIHDGCDIDTIFQWIDDGNAVYLIADEEDIMQCDLITEDQLVLKHEGHYKLEDYEFEIYNIQYR